MPCTYDDDGEDLRKASQEARDLTQMLCAICWFFEKAGRLEELIYPRHYSIAPWWKKHKEEDRKREELAKEAREASDLRAAGLAKLTTEEKEALRID